MRCGHAKPDPTHGAPSGWSRCSATCPGRAFTVPDAVLDFHLCRPEPRRHVAWMEERLGRSMAEFEAPIPHGRPDHLLDPDDWTAANLTHLTRPEADALLGLLRDGAAGGGAPRRKRARDGLQRAIAWLENRLAAPPVEPADAPWLRGAALQELAALLVGAEERPGEPQRPRGAADGDRPGLRRAEAGRVPARTTPAGQPASAATSARSSGMPWPVSLLVTRTSGWAAVRFAAIACTSASRFSSCAGFTLSALVSTSW
jgi:hypothetical protein